MTHPEMDELYDLYGMGVLEPELAAEIEQHLSEGCTYCAQRVKEARELMAELALLADQVAPPPSLRERVIASMQQRREGGIIPLVTSAPSRAERSQRPETLPKKISTGPSWWMLGGLVAACLAMAVALLMSRSELAAVRDSLASTVHERNELKTALESANTVERNEMASLRRERDQLQGAIQIVRRPETRSVQFGKGPATPHGMVFVNPSGGLVMVAGSLPSVAADRTLELWLVPTNGGPRPAGLFRPNAVGDSVNVSALSVSPAEYKAVAVSIEPRAGSAAPTTQPFLLVPLS